MTQEECRDVFDGLLEAVEVGCGTVALAVFKMAHRQEDGLRVLEDVHAQMRRQLLQHYKTRTIEVVH